MRCLIIGFLNSLSGFSSIAFVTVSDYLAQANPSCLFWALTLLSISFKYPFLIRQRSESSANINVGSVSTNQD